MPSEREHSIVSYVWLLWQLRRHKLAPALTDPKCTTVVEDVPAVNLSTIVAQQVLRGDEIILLMLKPSRWSILLQTAPVAIVLSIATAIVFLLDSDASASRQLLYTQIAGFVCIARLIWSTLAWMGRFYILTDARVVSLGGVSRVELVEVPLKNVSRTTHWRSWSERMFRLGSVQIVPTEEDKTIAWWSNIRNAQAAKEAIDRAVNRQRFNNRD